MARRSAGPNTAQGRGRVRGRTDSGTRRPVRQPAKRRAPAKPKPNKYSSSLYDPTTILAGKDLAKAAGALAGLTINPQLAALKRAESDATTQGNALIDRAGGYYSDLTKSGLEDSAREAAIGSKLQDALKAIGSTAQTTIGQAANSAAAGSAADAAVRGGGLSGGGDQVVQDELSAQRALAAGDAQRAQTSGAESTADYQALADLSAKATAARGGEVQQQLANQIANQRLNFEGQRQDLQGEKAAEKAKQLVDLRQSGFENLVTARGLNIKLQDLRAQIAQQKADQQLAARRQGEVERNNRAQQRTTRRGQTLQQKQAAQRDATARRGQDLTAEQRAADRRARQQIAAGRAKQHANESADSRKQRIGIANAVEDLRAGHDKRVRRDAPPLVYRAAKQIAASGFVGPETIREMRAAGIRIPRSWLPPGKKGTGAAGYPSGKGAAGVH